MGIHFFQAKNSLPTHTRKILKQPYSFHKVQELVKAKKDICCRWKNAFFLKTSNNGFFKKKNMQTISRKGRRKYGTTSVAVWRPLQTTLYGSWELLSILSKILSNFGNSQFLLNDFLNFEQKQKISGDLSTL